MKDSRITAHKREPVTPPIVWIYIGDYSHMTATLYTMKNTNWLIATTMTVE